MKLHSISIHNLNSLYGEHTINLQRDLCDAPLFLMMGSTGAGKSTILDAICLALFGQTPRLRGERGRPETAPALVMSHGTFSCRATVEFSKRESDGVRRVYRAEWSCRRAKNKPTGKLQDPHRSLARIHPGGHEELLVSDDRAKYIDPHFAEVLEGLTVEDFKRSVLLAQGEFAAFLSASKDEKASILERLTNTDEYKKIGERASARYKEVEHQKKQLEANLQGVELRSEEEEKTLCLQYEQEKQQLENCRQQVQVTTMVLQWLEEKIQCEAEVVKTEQQQQQAMQAVERGQSEQTRLEEYERCQELFPILLRVQEQEQNLHALEEKQSKCLEEKNTANAVFLENTTKLEQVQQRVQQAEQAWEQAQPILEEAQRRTGVLENLQSQYQQLEKQYNEENKKKQRQDKQRLAFQKQREEAQQLFTRVQQEYQTLAHLENLQHKLPVLETQTTQFLEQIDEYNNLIELLEDMDKQRQELDKEHDQAQQQQKTWQDKLLAQEENCEKAKTALHRLLGEYTDRRSFRLQQEAERTRLQQKIGAGTKGQERHSALVELLQKQADTEQALSVVQNEIQQAREEQARCDVALEVQEVRLQEQNIRLDTLKRILALVDERAALVENHPCPLCGSEHHPFRESAHKENKEASFAAERNACEQQIKEGQKTIKALQKQKQQAEKDLVRREEQMRVYQNNLAQYQTDFTETEQAWKQVWQGREETPPSHFPTTPEEQEIWLRRITQDIATWQQQEQQIQTHLEQLEELQQHLETAEKAWRHVQEQQAKFQVKQATLEERIRQHKQNTDTRKQEQDDKVASLKRAVNTLRERYDSFGLPVETGHQEVFDQHGEEMVPFDFSGTLDKAQTQYNAWLQAQQKKQEVQEKIQALESQQQENMRTLQETERIMAQFQEQMNGCAEEQRGQEKQMKELLQGQTLQDFRESLQMAMNTVKAEEKGIKKQWESTQTAFLRKRAEWEERERTLEEAQKTLSQTQVSLTEGVTRLGLESREQLVARKIEPDELKALQVRRKEREEKRIQARTQYEMAQQSWQRHLAERPVALGESPEDERVALWQQRVADYQKQEAECNRNIGVIEEQQKRQEQAKIKMAQLQREYNDVLEAWKVWKSINDLIGKKDGESFKLFAQSLNLQELVARANDRLRRLAPRYRLSVARGEQGEPLLDFRIKDRDQAEDERPITTLSGGETFLVSLSLALALADFRRIAMPIETLLLDEGFGTLDQETLDLVMQTLRQLQRESDQQIGLISHVEALKDRIDAQIWVEKRGNGRSSIRICVSQGRGSVSSSG